MPEKSAGVKSKIFKTSVITDEIDQDFETACDLAVEFGLDAVEIRSVYERGPFELTDDDIKCIRKILERKKLKVSAISSPFFKCKISDPDEINSQLEGLKRCIEICDQLDTSLIRGFTFWAQPGITATDIASHFGEAVSILEKTGKILVLESDPSVNATNGKKLAAVIEAVNSPYVQGLWDPGNDIWDPDNEIPYPDGYNFIKKYISHVHLKDGRRINGKAEGAPIGRGEVDWKGQFRALIDDGYSGFVTLETHYRPAKKFSAQELAMPKGAAFSLGGYGATKESLGLWKKLLSSI